MNHHEYDPHKHDIETLADKEYKKESEGVITFDDAGLLKHDTEVAIRAVDRYIRNTKENSPVNGWCPTCGRGPQQIQYPNYQQPYQPYCGSGGASCGNNTGYPSGAGNCNTAPNVYKAAQPGMSTVTTHSNQGTTFGSASAGYGSGFGHAGGG